MFRHINKVFFWSFAGLISLYFTSCKYDYIEFEQPPVTDTVYFATQIQPIFNDNCIACHKTGGQAPDLTSGNAYNSIQSMGLVSLSDPESSVLYQYPDPDFPDIHSWKKLIPTQVALILNWIKQGALNNK
ncbi:MAG: cytochrome c [Chlorobi bacterium]|nr:cytochrome c [Chlorobiota bacterium]